MLASSDIGRDFAASGARLPISLPSFYAFYHYFLRMLVANREPINPALRYISI